MSEQYLSAIKYLEQLEALDANINQDIEDLQNKKINATSTGGFNCSERVQTSPTGDAMCKAVSGYVDFENEINAEIDRFVNAKNQIKREIRGLRNAKYIKVLYKKYVQFKSLKQISTEINLSYTYVLELHKKALIEFEETYKNLTYLT